MIGLEIEFPVFKLLTPGIKVSASAKDPLLYKFISVIPKRDSFVELLI